MNYSVIVAEGENYMNICGHYVFVIAPFFCAASQVKVNFFNTLVEDIFPQISFNINVNRRLS
jgi:hypothetical protein